MVDSPSWILDHGVREGWSESEWKHWRRLSTLFDAHDVELVCETLEGAPTAIHALAGDGGRWIGGVLLDDGDAMPLHAL